MAPLLDSDSVPENVGEGGGPPVSEHAAIDDHAEDLESLWPTTTYDLTDTARQGIQELLARYEDIEQRMDADTAQFQAMLQEMTRDYMERMTSSREQVKELVQNLIKEWAESSDSTQHRAAQLDHDKHLVSLLGNAVASRTYNIPVEASGGDMDPAGAPS